MSVNKHFSEDLINQLAIVNLSDEEVYCSFKIDNSFSKNISSTFDFSKIESITEATSEINTASSTHSPRDEFLSQLALAPDCKLNGIATRTPLKLSLPIYIYDSNQQLMRHITFEIKGLAKDKKIIKLAWPEVRFQDNSTLIDLLSICGVETSPVQALTCESKDIPTDWVQQNCRLSRTNFEYLKFNTTFSNNVTTETCQIELIPNEDGSSTLKLNTEANEKESFMMRMQSSTTIETPTTLNIADNDAMPKRDKRHVVRAWDLIPGTFGCRQQNKYQKMRIPYYYYRAYADEQISDRYANTMRLTVRTLNQLNLFEIIHFRDSSDVDYLSEYFGPKIIIESERLLSKIRAYPLTRSYLPPGTLCDGLLFFNKIGCRENHHGFNQLGIAALTRQLLNWFGMKDMRIGERENFSETEDFSETVDFRETQGIYRPKKANSKAERKQSPFANGPIRINAYNDDTKRIPQLLENYDVVSLFSIMHKPLNNSANYELDGKRISELLIPFNQSFKFDFISLIKDKNLNSRVIIFLDINTLAKIIYFHAPESLLGRQFNLPDFIFIEGQYLEEPFKAAFSNVISELKKQKKFNYSLLAQNKTRVLTASNEPFNENLIIEFKAVSLSDGEIRCQFGDLSFLEDQFKTENLTSFNISQSDSLSESTSENIPSIAKNDFEHELLKRFNISLENCKLTGFFPEAIQLTLPILITDSKHNLTQYITFKVKNPPIDNYLIINKNYVKAVGNAARIDLKKLCEVVAVPDGNIVCQPQGMPIHWQHEDCWITRDDEQSAKFNVSFFYASKKNSCAVEIISTLPLIKESTKATTPTDTPTTRKSLFDPRFTVLVRIIKNERKLTPSFQSTQQINPPMSTINPVDDIYNKIVEKDKLTTQPLATMSMPAEPPTSSSPLIINELSTPITPKFSNYKKTDHEIDQAPMKLIMSDQRPSIHSSNSKEKSVLTAICGIGITFAASLVAGIGYCWIRRFRNSRSGPQTLEAVAAVSLPLLEQATGSRGEETSDIKIIDAQNVGTNTLSSSVNKVKIPSSLNIPPKKVASLAKNDHSLFSTKKSIQGRKLSNKQPAIAFLNKPANKLENKQFFSNPPLPQPTAPKSSESNISFTTLLGNNSSSYAIRYVLYSLGFKPTVERMNHAERLENINDRDQEIDKIEQRLNLALQCYK